MTNNFSSLWTVKKSPAGRMYRVATVPIMDLMQFLDDQNLQVKTCFHFAPEARDENDFVLGVRPKEDPDERPKDN